MVSTMNFNCPLNFFPTECRLLPFPEDWSTARVSRPLKIPCTTLLSLSNTTPLNSFATVSCFSPKTLSSCTECSQRSAGSRTGPRRGPSGRRVFPRRAGPTRREMRVGSSFFRRGLRFSGKGKSVPWQGALLVQEERTPVRALDQLQAGAFEGKPFGSHRMPRRSTAALLSK